MCEVKAMVRLLPHDNDVMIVTITEHQNAAAVNTADVKGEKPVDSLRSMNSAHDSMESISRNDIEGVLLRVSVQKMFLSLFYSF